MFGLPAGDGELGRDVTGEAGWLPEAIVPIPDGAPPGRTKVTSRWTMRT